VADHLEFATAENVVRPNTRRPQFFLPLGALCSLAGRCSAPAGDGDELLGFVQRRKRIAAGVRRRGNLHPSAILCGLTNRRATMSAQDAVAMPAQTLAQRVSVLGGHR
jgi:hypothetical protein